MVNNHKNNNLSKKRERTAQKIIEALKEHKGLVTKAARKAGVSYSTLVRYANDFPSVKEAVKEAKEAMLDHTESKLFEKIEKGDTVAILFYLKTQGKHRGYIERQEFTGEAGKPIAIAVEVVSENAKKLTEQILKSNET